MKKLMAVILLTIAIAAQAGSSGSCGTKITCKPGNEAKCEMTNGSSDIFMQVSYLNLSEKTDLALSDLYAYTIKNNGVVDCYYSLAFNPYDVIVFKTLPHHNVVPRDSSEWVKRYDTLYCDPDIHSCLIYILY